MADKKTTSTPSPGGAPGCRPEITGEELKEKIAECAERHGMTGAEGEAALEAKGPIGDKIGAIIAFLADLWKTIGPFFPFKKP